MFLSAANKQALKNFNGFLFFQFKSVCDKIGAFFQNLAYYF
jgi:hypothetical protein